jgi:hypothetical protein
VKLESKFEGGRARKQAAAPSPFGPSFDADIVAKTQTLEVHSSKFKAPGRDRYEFSAFDTSGHLVGQKRIEG